ncbi:MAG TPA: riboflavin synthase [Parasegetibacter sp.]|jgi:riboflavin synthase
MFTGIIEQIGIITAVESLGTNRRFVISSPISSALKVDQSVSHNGICLTVEKVDGDTHQVTAIFETLQKTNASSWKSGDKVNLERCLQMNGRLDGHIVQGHVDTTGNCIEISDKDGSREFTIEFPEQFAPLVIEKGSISLNGISLTIFNVTKNHFTVAIIPYTLEHTNLNQLVPGDSVNLEFDIVGKYVHRIAALNLPLNRS